MIVATILIAYVWFVWYTSYTIYGDNGKPYMTRYYPLGKLPRRLFDCNLFIHHFHASDYREYHDHPWKNSVSLILWGGYEEFRRQYVRHPSDVQTMFPLGWVMTPDYDEWSTVYRPFSINRIHTNTFHFVRLLNEERGCWTLFFAGSNPESEWGFIEANDRYMSASARKANTLGND